VPVYLLPEEPLFPPASDAEPDGLLAIGGDLSPKRLIHAYAQGIFPWFSEEDEIFWFSPDPRLVLIPGHFRKSDSLNRIIRNRQFEVRFDTCFQDVIEACAAVPRSGQDGTWITADFVDAYRKLHDAGLAHSVEVFRDGRLTGGLYGVSMGSAFFGESMFHHERDASKIAFYHLSEQLLKWNFTLIDCQVESAHLISLGAELISREFYLMKLETALQDPTKRGIWRAVS
jgi:leucyl/phenylalanyl-tRNA---protein transferase